MSPGRPGAPVQVGRVSGAGKKRFNKGLLVHVAKGGYLSLLMVLSIHLDVAHIYYIYIYIICICVHMYTHAHQGAYAYRPMLYVILYNACFHVYFSMLC